MNKYFVFRGPKPNIIFVASMPRYFVFNPVLRPADYFSLCDIFSVKPHHIARTVK
jgi:hypothetical protein